MPNFATRPAWAWGALAVAAAAAGCSTPQQQAAGECAAGGAVAAIALCKLLGGSNAACAGAGGLGGGLAGVACYNYSANLEKRRQALAGRENDLNARIQYVRDLNADSEKLIASLKERVKAARQRSADLDASVGANRATANQLAKVRSQLDAELKTANADLTLQRSAYDDMRRYQARRSTASPNLDSEISRQAELLAQAQRQVDTMASLRERV